MKNSQYLAQFDISKLKTSLVNEDKTGIYLIDKPVGMTSHDVVAIFRKQLGVKRVGHSGTLDPLATGLLIVLVGREYTKLQDRFLKLDKEYEFTSRLGMTTDSFDADGEIVSQVDWESLNHLSADDVSNTLTKFAGEIDQAVPVFSAVKVQGRKLYAHGRAQRRGEAELEVDLPVRKVNIISLELIDFNRDDKNQQLLFSARVYCSSGTYIRSLSQDIGQTLGVGATVVSLRRTKVAHLDVKNALQLSEI